MNPLDEKAKIEKQRTFQEDIIRAQEEVREAEIEAEREAKEKLKKEGDIAQKSFSASQGFSLEAQENYFYEEEQDIGTQQQEFIEDPSVEKGKESAKSFLKEKGYDITDEDLDGLSEKKPEKVDFPMIMFFFALAKDVIDILSGGLLSWVYGGFYFVGNMLWVSGRAEKFSFAGKGVVRLIRKRLITRFTASGLAETIPILSVLPLASLFVVLNHYSETKLVKAFQVASSYIIK